MDPQQELFTKLLTEIKALGYDVYDGFLPPDGTPYPFVYLADSQQTDDANKTAVFGNVYQTIHVWHNNPRQRGTVSKMFGDQNHMQKTGSYRKFCMGCPECKSENSSGYNNKAPSFTRVAGNRI